MDKTIRPILFVLIILVALSSFTALWFFMEKEMLYTNYTSLDKLFEANVVSTDKLSREFVSLAKKNKGLKSEIGIVEEKLDVLEAKNRELGSQYEALSDEKDGLGRELVKIKKGKSFLEKKLKDLTSKGVLSKFKDMKRENRFLKSKISKLEKGFGKLKNAFTKKLKDEEVRAEAYHSPDEVELPPIVLERNQHRLASLTPLSPLDHMNKTSDLKGRVITVNRDHNFVVIDLGRDDGIQVGNSFSVYKGNTIVAYVEVIQARNKIAAADIKDIKEGFRIEIDDVVVKR